MKIGVFDSGIGGITILKECLKKINADYIYLADNLNCPYGNKDKKDLEKYIFNSIEILYNKGCRIIIIACNTATMISIEKLRKKYKDVVIIGTEPAIKPAKEYLDKNKGKLLVVATSVTLKQDKFLKHLKSLNLKKNDINLIPLNELVKLIENEEYMKMKQYLESKFQYLVKEEYTAVVLGCTHFPLVESLFQEIFYKAKIFSPNKGISNYLATKISNRSDKSSLEVLLTKNDEEFLNDIKRRIEF